MFSRLIPTWPWHLIQMYPRPASPISPLTAPLRCPTSSLRPPVPTCLSLSEQHPFPSCSDRDLGVLLLTSFPLAPQPLSNSAARLTNSISKISQMHPVSVSTAITQVEVIRLSHLSYCWSLLSFLPKTLWWLPRGPRIKFKCDLPFLPLQCPRLGHSSLITTVHHSGLILALWANQPLSTTGPLHMPSGPLPGLLLPSSQHDFLLLLHWTSAQSP